MSAAEGGWRVAPATALALASGLVLYPGFRMAVSGFDLFGGIEGVGAWWRLWGVMLVGHWLLAAVVLSAVASEGGGLASIGLDPGAWVRRRGVLLGVLVVAVGVAAVAPGLHYGDDLPARMSAHPLGPVGPAQRVFWVAMAVTAGVVEEVVYRGYALTRLSRLLGTPAAVVLSLASFTLLHGPSAFQAGPLVLYLVSGGLFTAVFLALSRRRLEWLIVAHAGFDLAIVGAP